MDAALQRVVRRMVLLLGVALCLAAPGFASDEVFERTYPLASGGRFTLENVNGSVQVEGWEREQVEICAVKSAPRNQLDLGRVKIEVQADSGSVAVRTRYPQGSAVDVAVDYRVRVPYRVLLRSVETVNGTLRIRGVDGTGELRSVNGNVEVFDSAGRFSARTTNGNLHLELRELREGSPMALETVNGSVLLALPSDAGADLNIRSMNGDFHSELPVQTQSSLSARAFHGRLGAGGSEISVRTINGGIRVVVERPSV